MPLNKCFLILCYSRADLLKQCLSSCLEARGSDEYSLVVVRQTGNDEVRQVLDSLRDRIRLMVEVDGWGRPEENIRRNRFLGYFACYETLGAEIVLAVEDDVQISSDSLEFINQMYLRYMDHPRFMGINLGSVEPRSADLLDSYSLLRYGLHGQASVLARRTWKAILESPVVQYRSQGHFDLAIEPILRRGFMVTPNNSRHLDSGAGGTHAPTRSIGDYFSQIEQSWVGNIVSEELDFRHRQIPHSWRADAVQYRGWMNPYYRFIEPRRRLRGVRRSSA